MKAGMDDTYGHGPFRRWTVKTCVQYGKYILTFITAPRKTSGYALHILTANTSICCRTGGSAVRPCTDQNQFAIASTICQERLRSETFGLRARISWAIKSEYARRRQLFMPSVPPLGAPTVKLPYRVRRLHLVGAPTQQIR